MRWSKLRTLIRERFAPPFDKRLDIHSAAYGACTCGHAWMTLDGAVIANFCTRAFWTVDYTIPRYGPELGFNAAANPMYDEQLATYGERSRQQLYRAIFDFVHTIPVEDALTSEDMLLQALAIVDARVGKRRLARLDHEKLHPLCGFLLMLRRGEAEGISPAEYSAMRRSEAAVAA